MGMTFYQRIEKQTFSFFEFFGRFVFFSYKAFANIRKNQDKDILLKQMYNIGVLSLPVVLITGSFTGMVLTLQSYYQLHIFTLENLVSPIVSLSMIRELGPVLTALMIASRVGAAITVEIGTMKVTDQIDALNSLYIEPGD